MQPIEIIIIIFASLVVIGTIAYNIVKKKKGTKICGCNCENCSGKGGCHK